MYDIIYIWVPETMPSTSKCLCALVCSTLEKQLNFRVENMFHILYMQHKHISCCMHVDHPPLPTPVIVRCLCTHAHCIAHRITSHRTEQNARVCVSLCACLWIGGLVFVPLFSSGTLAFWQDLHNCKSKSLNYVTQTKPELGRGVNGRM